MNNGNLQKLLNRFFSLAILFDDNQEIEVFLLGNKQYGMKKVNANNYANFILEIITQEHYANETAYHLPVEEALNHYFQDQSSTWSNDDPVFCTFLTDGIPYPKESVEKARQLIAKAANQGMPIFFKFLALDSKGCDYACLKSIDTDKSRKIDNSHFVLINQPEKLTFEQLIIRLLFTLSLG